MRPHKKVFRPCAVCGKAFQRGRAGRQVTCSPECSLRRRQQWERRRYDSTSYEDKCKMWNKANEAKRADPEKWKRHLEQVRKSNVKYLAKIRIQLGRAPSAEGPTKKQLVLERKICKRCMRVEPEAGKTMCRPCLDYMRAKLRVTYDRRKKLGLCPRCGKVKAHGLCGPCRHIVAHGGSLSDFYPNSKARPGQGGKKTHNMRRPYPMGFIDRVAYFGRRCAWCGSEQWHHVDHVFPLARGGKHLPANLVPACSSCNLAKSDMHPAEFAATLGDRASGFARLFNWLRIMKRSA